MTSAQYAVVRVIADPARDEPVNVGVLLWSKSTYRLAVDREALQYVARRHPFLASDALLFVEDYLRRNLDISGEYVPEAITAAIKNLSRPPVSLTEPRFIALARESADAVEAALDELVDRVVRLPQRLTGGRMTPKRQIRQFLKPLLDRNLVEEDRVFIGKTGNPRRIDFFANGKAQIGLDVVSMNKQDAEEIQRRSDAVAYKVLDILNKQELLILLYCTFPEDERFFDAISSARRSMRSAGAEVLEDLQSAVAIVRDRASLI